MAKSRKSPSVGVRDAFGRNVKNIVKIQAKTQIKFDKSNFVDKINRYGERSRLAMLRALREVLKNKITEKFIMFLEESNHMGATSQLANNLYFSITDHNSGVSISLNSNAKDIRGEVYFAKVFAGHKNDEDLDKLAEWMEFKDIKPEYLIPIHTKIKNYGSRDHSAHLISFKTEIKEFINSPEFTAAVQREYTKQFRGTKSSTAKRSKKSSGSGDIDVSSLPF